MTSSHLSFGMRCALNEARVWLGVTAPNPPVGAAALDEHGVLLAVAAHPKAGEAHAEAALLEKCRTQNLLPRVHTICVTLEPCNHQGRTPPCTEALLQAGIKRIAIGTMDPNPQVKGGGAEKLKRAGLEIIIGVEEEACLSLIHAFAYRVKTGQPFLTLKRALTQEGSMIPPTGQKTFTSPQSLSFAHRLRKKADAIITGSGTILTDEPHFTVRHINDHVGKRRWLGILDRRQRVSKAYIALAKQRGLDAIIYSNIHEALADLREKEAQDILVEAGPQLSQSFLDQNLWSLAITLHQGAPDRMETRFHPQSPIFFETRTDDWLPMP